MFGNSIIAIDFVLQNVWPLSLKKGSSMQLNNFIQMVLIALGKLY